MKLGVRAGPNPYFEDCSVCGGERIRQLAARTCAAERLPFPTFLLAPMRKYFKADARHHVIKCTDLCNGGGGLMFPSVAKLEE